MAAKAKRLPWIVRVVHARLRLAICAAIGIAVAVALPSRLTFDTRALIGWDLALLIYLGAVGHVMARAPVDLTNRFVASMPLRGWAAVAGDLRFDGVTRMPEFEGKVTAGVDNGFGYYVRGGVSGPLSDAVVGAVEQEIGRRPELSTGGGTSDGRFIATLGAQVVELGVPNASIHKVNESVGVDEIDALHRLYVGALKNLLA